MLIFATSSLLPSGLKNLLYLFEVSSYQARLDSSIDSDSDGKSVYASLGPSAQL